ncbi:MAG: adenylate/guanylate cyclase domain-containing protein [Bacteroidota bacterium]
MKPVILCVDDEKFVLESLKEQLYVNLEGSFTIETAESGRDAIEILEELNEENQEVGVIIADYIMPGMKGDELLVTIHEKSPNTIKILLTGQADLRAVGDAVNKANLYRYITKPWDANDLALTVKEALISFAQNQQLAQQNEQLVLGNKRLANLNAAYERFIPREFLNLLGQQSITSVQLGDYKCYDMSILFADIRSFTELSEQMTNQENFNFINGYLKRLSPIIRQYNGFIDKYLGDGIMALFPNNVTDAIQAGIAMQKQLEQYNLERLQKGRPPIKVGIGVHYGSVMFGTVGEQERMESTVISDAVNVAARLEYLSKKYNANLIISQTTYEQLNHPEQFTYRHLHRVQLKGKSQPIMALEVLDADPPNIRTQKLALLDKY